VIHHERTIARSDINSRKVVPTLYENANILARTGAIKVARVRAEWMQVKTPGVLAETLPTMPAAAPSSFTLPNGMHRQ